jgi:tripartite-type tricarboxylate transporter receptor subunit TctC
MRSDALTRSFAALALAAIACALPAVAAAQGFPNRPIKVVVPYPPGGGTDVVTRIITAKMATVMDATIVVDNRAGAGGNIGTEVVARSPADGYTLLVATGSTTINNTLTPNLSWELMRDFAPVVQLAWNQSVLVANPAFPVNNVAELIALAKSKPGKITYGSSGIGSSAHLWAELFKLKAGVDLTHVPYKGTAPAQTDLVSGQINVMFTDISAALPFIKSGKMKALGVGSLTRFEGLPDVPTIAESGVPGYEGGSVVGLVAPAGTPRPVIDALNAAAVKTLATPEIRERLTGLASTPIGGTPDEFGARLRGEIDKWALVIRTASIKPE